MNTYNALKEALRRCLCKTFNVRVNDEICLATSDRYDPVNLLAALTTDYDPHVARDIIKDIVKDPTDGTHIFLRAVAPQPGCHCKLECPHKQKAR